MIVVDANWLYDRMKRNSDDVRILAADWGCTEREREFKSAHIAGALYFNTDRFENQYPRWFLLSHAELAQVIVDELQIVKQHERTTTKTTTTTVVVYSNRSISAARTWFILRYAGVRNVYILDGGVSSWIRAGFATSSCTAISDGGFLKNNKKTKSSSSSLSSSTLLKAQSSMLARTAYVEQRYQFRDDVILLDCRSKLEWKGVSSGYDYASLKGRIPNAGLCFGFGFKHHYIIVFFRKFILEIVIHSSLQNQTVDS